jgi:hypothetical protein
LIKYSRGKIQILEPEALQDSACECYAAVRAHYERLVGPPPAGVPDRPTAEEARKVPYAELEK